MVAHRQPTNSPLDLATIKWDAFHSYPQELIDIIKTLLSPVLFPSPLLFFSLCIYLCILFTTLLLLIIIIISIFLLMLIHSLSPLQDPSARSTPKDLLSRPILQPVIKRYPHSQESFVYSLFLHSITITVYLSTLPRLLLRISSYNNLLLLLLLLLLFLSSLLLTHSALDHNSHPLINY